MLELLQILCRLDFSTYISHNPSKLNFELASFSCRLIIFHIKLQTNLEDPSLSCMSQGESTRDFGNKENRQCQTG